VLETIAVVIDRGDDARLVVTEHARKRLPERRNDSGAQHIAPPQLRADALERMRKARGDAGLRIDQRAVEIEQHQPARRRPRNIHHARASSAATAGSFMPSRNSRNAPPPVEMYEILSATPYFSIAASVSPPPAIENAFESAMA